MRRQRRRLQAGGIDQHVAAQAHGLVAAELQVEAAFGAHPAGHQRGVEHALGAGVLGIALVGQHQRVAVDDAGGRRHQRRRAAQRRFQPHGVFAGNELQIVHAVGAGALRDAFELRGLLGAGGHDQLAQPLVRNAAFGAIGVQQVLAAHAQAGLEAARGVIDAGVDHFGIARAGAGADGLGGLGHQHLAARLGQGAGDG